MRSQRLSSVPMMSILRPEQKQANCSCTTWSLVCCSASVVDQLLQGRPPHRSSQPPRRFDPILLAHLMQQAIKDLKYSPFKKALLGSCSDGGIVELWDTASRTPYTSWKQHTAPVTSIQFSPVNHMLFTSVGLDQHIFFYDVQDKKLIVLLALLTECRMVKAINAFAPLTSLAFMDNGYTIAIGTSQGGTSSSRHDLFRKYTSL